RIDPAEAPADEQNFAALAAFLQPPLQPLDRVGPRATVPAELPPVHAPAGFSEGLAQRQCRAIARGPAGNDERRRSILGPEQPRSPPSLRQPRQQPHRLVQPAPVGRRAIVADELVLHAREIKPVTSAVQPQRYSPPISSCSTG